MQVTKLNLELPFPTKSLTDLRVEQFKRSSLGQLYLTIPFGDLAAKFPAKKHRCGVQPIFTIEGGIGLMFLKSYTGLSDEKLIESLNGNWMYQMFCGIRLGAGQRIRDRGIISRWRVFLGQHLDISSLQKTLIEHWNTKMEDTQTNLSDATCYESYVRYPTDTKLQWEGIDWLHTQMCRLCNYTKTRHPRNKYRQVKKTYLSYSKRRRKTYKLRRKMTRRLLHLLNKLLGQISRLIGYWQTQIQVGRPSPVRKNFFQTLATIKQMYRQQQWYFDRPDVPIKQRIVSIFKPYLRPIVRGKENKRVEFGKKVHKMMVGGLSFIEHWSFEAFHEGNRTKRTIWKHRSYFGQLSRFSGDRIYATNKNRKFCSQQKIFTSFQPKGRRGKQATQQAQMRNILNKQRATVLEGSFGNEKNHYGLSKVKARTARTEKVWIFFGIMCANGVKLTKKPKPPPV